MRNPDEPTRDEQRAHLRSMLHIYVGIEVALHRWPEISALAFDTEEADSLRLALIELLDVDDVQAAAISDLQLRRISRLERQLASDRVLELRRQLNEIDAE